MSPYPAEQACHDIYALIDRNDIRRAGPACEQLVRQHPEYAPGWAAFSELWLRVGRADEACRCADEACRLDPDNTAFTAQSAKCRVFHGDLREARARAEQALAGAPDRHDTLDTLGNVFSRLGDHARALEIFRRCLELAPDHPAALYNLATSLHYHGETDEAEALYHRLLEHDPDDAEALHARSVLRRQTPEHNHIDDLTDRLERNPSWPAAARLAYALAKEYEDLGREAEAFAAADRGAASMRAHLPDRFEADLSDLAAATAAPDAGWFRQPDPAGHDSREPVFIIGLPRTGTTLIERILDHYPEVAAAGELHNFRIEAGRMTGTDGAAGIYQALDATAAFDFAGLGRRYIDSTRPTTGGTPLFLDKMPRNDLWAPLIHRALPGARFILLERHPMDAGYALYKTLFHTGWHFTYDLARIGRYILGWRRLAARLKAALSRETLLPVAYEDLVSAPAVTARTVTDFCGLEWRESCLATDRAGGTVVTASAHQVREPIHTDSAGRWRRLERELEPLRRVLADGGVEF